VPTANAAGAVAAAAKIERLEISCPAIACSLRE
jgi:hypothetical protein